MVEVTGGVTAVADTTGRSFKLDDVTYTGNANASELTYSETASADEVETIVAANTGVTATVSFTDNTTTSGGADATYVDRDGELTTTASFTTDYNVNADTGTGKYEADVGATVNVSSEGLLTTAETSKGDRTENPLASLDSALSTVDSLRSDLGAIQNRFESAITNLSTTETNLSAARSRIEDADYAVEVANMTRAQILQQAGTSVLAQANQLPQNVLSLLG